MKKILLVTIFIIILLTPLSSPPTNISEIVDKTENKGSQVKNYKEEEISRKLFHEASTTWERTLASIHFTIHYNVTGPNQVPDSYAESLNESLEFSWETEVNQYGFSAPPDSHTNVYIMELPDDYAITYGLYYELLDEYHVGNITFDRNMPIDLMQYVAAHELFHCIQLSYRITAGWFIQGIEDWVMEGTAVWMGSAVYPEYTGTVSFVDYANQFLQNPDRLITQLDYDAVLFWIYLFEHYGSYGIIRNIIGQNENLNAIEAVNATLLSSHGKTFNEVFKEWTVANLLKDTYYSKGLLFNSITTRQLPEYTGFELIESSDVTDWGADYIEISSSEIYMPILFEGDSTINSTKILIEYGIPLTADFILNSSFMGFFSLMQANSLDSLVIIVRSLGDSTSSNRVDYTITFKSQVFQSEGPFQVNSSIHPLVIVKSNLFQNGSHSNIALIGTPSVIKSSNRTITVTHTQNIIISSSRTMTIANGSSTQYSSTVNDLIIIFPWDVTGDGYVGIDDLILVAEHFGDNPNTPGWNPILDINGDGYVGIDDIIDAAEHFGESG